MLLHNRRGKTHHAAPSLQTTSMMDMFTIILVFLLKSFSAEGSILTNADNLALPNSDSRKKPVEVNLQVAVTEKMVLVDNIPVVPTADVIKMPSDQPNPLIPLLHDKLRACLRLEKELVRSGALTATEGKVVIQIDKNMAFDVLYKVMNTCGSAGYTTMHFAVMEREE